MTEFLTQKSISQKNSEYGSLNEFQLSRNHSVEDDFQATKLLKFSSIISPLRIAAMLSTAFTYGCIMTTLFLLTLPMECQRIEYESSKYYSFTIKKSIALGSFAAVAGAAQLITPIIGMMSDNYKPPIDYSTLKYMGKRLPYLLIGIFMILVGVLGQFFSSLPIHKLQDVIDPTDETVPRIVIMGGNWFQYLIFYSINMIGLNVVYTGMIAFIPDYVPHSQTGLANGTLALMLVIGSLFGFGTFHLIFRGDIMSMYKLYMVVTFISGILTCFFVMGREHELHYQTSEDMIHNDAAAFHERKVPSFNDYVKLLFFNPMLGKSYDEIRSAYWIDITHHRDFFYVTISRFFYYMGISSQTFFLYFVHDKFHNLTQDPKSIVSILAMTGQFAGAITCLPVGIVSDKYFGSRRKCFVYLSCVALSCGNLLLLLCRDFYQMMSVCFLIGAANGIYLTMDTSLAVDTLEQDEQHQDGEEDHEGEKGNFIEATTKEGPAQLLGVWGVFGFVGSASGPLIGGIALLIFGRNDGESTFYTEKGYIYLFSLSAIYFLCSAIVLTFVKKKGV